MTIVAPRSRVIVTILCAMKYSRDDAARLSKTGFITPAMNQPRDALARLDVGYQFAIRIVPALAYFGDLSLGQLQVTHMPDIVEQRARSGVLLRLGQMFDLAQRLFEQFCHGRNLAYGRPKRPLCPRAFA